MKHLARLLDCSSSELHALLDRTRALREGAVPADCRGRILGLVFEKPSTRTRVSFEAAAMRLGAGSMFISARDSQLGRGEPIEDTARVLGRYLDAIALRTYGQSTVEAMAEWSGIPVINALSDAYHPCQALADAATIEQHLGRREQWTLAYLGDGNNVFASLAELAGLLDVEVRFAGPAGYDPDAALIEEIRARGGRVTLGRDPVEAVRGADAVYTDVWTSMGQEEEAADRRRIFAEYQLRSELLAHAPQAIVLHCLPAHRGEEITAEVIEGPQSRVFDQAENRMWGQMAVLEALWQEAPLR
jgi:ornithine carbamoyltransferase